MSRARDLASSGVTSTVLSAKAPLASPDFTGTVDLTGTTISLDNDQISGDKVSGGEIGAGTFNGTIGSNATVTPGNYSSSLTFSTSIPNNTLTTVYDLGSHMSDNDSATVLITVTGWPVNARVIVLKDSGGYQVNLDTQRIAYVSAVSMSGDNLQVQLSTSSGSKTVKGRVYIHKGF